MAKKTATKKKPAAARRKSKKSVRIALIGAGSRSVSTHYPALSDLPEADVVAACDLDEDRLQTACDRFGIQGRYGDYRQMIEREKPDAVYAIMPPHHLYDVSADIIERGCHLIVEKPPAVTTEQTRQLALLAQKHNVLTGVTFQRRFSPLIRRGKERCEKRGDVHTAHASFYKNWVGADAYYKGCLLYTSDAADE